MRHRANCVVRVALGWAFVAGACACACAENVRQEHEVNSPVPSHGKQQAPVDIDGTVAREGAVLSLRFAADAEDVRVHVAGTDGLLVRTGATPVRGQSVRAGERLPISIAFEAPRAASNVALTVSGLFGGMRRTRIASFTVPGVGLSAKTDMNAQDDGVVQIGTERVRLLPAASR